ncbi:cytochrome P450 [Collybia nuda]|uniref:Cytochrome P450 n=1 Tax=Collybia nuda TaxID=64659 RepID=A0A9P6CDU9_9AGAR|nr:cytochrome P450 [Collybia nuda]
MSLPPGVLFLINRIPQIFSPILTCYVILTALLRLSSSVQVSFWKKLLVSFIFQPLLVVIKVWYRDYMHMKEARGFGAESPPRYKHSKIGGLDIIQALSNQLEEGYIGDVFHDMMEREKSSTIIFRTLFEDRYVTADPEHIKAMLTTQFDNFNIGNSDFLGALLGNGIFTSDGDLWRFHRGIIRPFFNKGRITDFEIFERHTQVALDQATARLQEGVAVDMQDLFSRFTMDSSAEFLLGDDVRSLSAALPYPPSSPLYAKGGPHSSDAFTKDFRRAQDLVSERGQRGRNWPLWEFWKDEIKERRIQLTDYINPILERALERKRNKGEKNGGKEQKTREVKEVGSMLDYLVGQTEDKTLLLDTILGILLAGRDTTGCSLTFTLYMLAEHPSVLKKVREEIIEHLGLERSPTFDDMRKMKYLRAVINETLRLYPPVPTNIRVSVRSTVLPNKDPGQKGIFIPAGTQVTFIVLLMHRRKDLWGPDALEFDPDRWLDDRVKHYTSNPFIFVPFNAGARICLGQQFAYHATSYFIIRYLQRFSKITPPWVTT